MQTGAYSAPTDTKRRLATLQRTATPGVYKRGRRYYVVFRDPSGRQRKKSLATLMEARAFKASVTASIYRGDYLPDPTITVADYASRWIASYGGRTARGLRPRTRRSYLLALGFNPDGTPNGSGAIAYFGRRKLASIRPPDIRAFGEWLAENDCARNTIRVTLAPLKAMFATAYEDGLILSNPTANLRMGPKALAAPVKNSHALTEDELRRVLEQIPRTYQFAIEMLADTGMRVSELLALQKTDIDLEQRLVHITKSTVDGDRGSPKTKHSARAVSYSAGISARLASRIENLSDDDLVFTRADGRPFTRSRLYHVVRDAAERAGISWPAGLHTLRHTYATILFRRGVPKEQIRTALGHDSWEFTHRVYIHDDTIPSTGILAMTDAG